jgi:sigma-E factor negative regulatory protein RseB
MPNSQRYRGLLWGLICFCSSSITLANEAEALVSRIAAATRDLTYDGVFIYARDSHVDAMRIAHTFENGVELERLIALSGPPREVVRDGKRVTCTFPNNKAVMVEKREPRDYVGLALSKPIEQIGRYYDFELTGAERIAGRPTRIVAIKPRSPDRYMLRLWIDEATNLLLKSAVLGDNGTVLEQVMFTQIAIGAPLSPTALQAELDGVGYTQFTNAEPVSPPEEFDLSKLTVAWLPSGFEMKNAHTQRIATREVPVRHLVYSDGLAMVSVFVEKRLAGAVPLQGYTVMGAVNAFSRVDNNYQITVVGEVPQATVRHIAASVAINNSH